MHANPIPTRIVLAVYYTKYQCVRWSVTSIAIKGCPSVAVSDEESRTGSSIHVLSKMTVIMVYSTIFNPTVCTMICYASYASEDSTFFKLHTHTRHVVHSFCIIS